MSLSDAGIVSAQGNVYGVSTGITMQKQYRQHINKSLACYLGIKDLNQIPKDEREAATIALCREIALTKHVPMTELASAGHAAYRLQDVPPNTTISAER